MDPYTCAFKTTFYLPDSQAKWKRKHQNKPLHIRNNPQGKPALEIILPYNYPVYNLLCIFFSQKNADLETKPEKDARKPWQGSDHGLLRNGRGGREMCLQLGLPRAGPITSVQPS